MQAEIAEIEENDPTSIHVSSNDSLARVLGKEHAGRVRSLGSGICPSVAFGRPSYHGSSSQRASSQRASSQQSFHEVSSEIQWQKKVEGLENELETVKTAFEFERVSRQKWERAVIALYSKCGMEMPDDLANDQVISRSYFMTLCLVLLYFLIFIIIIYVFFNLQSSHSAQNEGQQHGSEDGGAQDSDEQ